MFKKTKVLIVGMGALGRGLRSVLNSNQTLYKVFDKDPQKNKSKESFESLSAWAEVIFLAIPSWEIENVLKNLSLSVRKKSIIVICSKGVSEKAGDFSFEIAASYFSANQIVYIGGPMLADELINGKGGACVIASQSKKSASTVVATLNNTIATEFYSDLRGIALQGVLKNIFSIVIGMAIQEKYGQNYMSVLSFKIIEEMVLITERIGFDSTKVFTYAGISDFLATSSSQNSAHVQVGRKIAAGKKYPACEGIGSLVGLKNRYPQIYKEFPLFKGIYDVFNKKLKPSKFLKSIIN